MAISQFAGTYNALSYGYGNAGVPAPPLQVLSGSNVSGTYTLTCQASSPGVGGASRTSGGASIPISTSTPILIGGDSQMETVTPSAVSLNSFNQLLITATFTYAHGTGAQVSSGTFGLQEAVNAAAAAGGGLVAVDAAWFRAGGTLAIINAVTPGAGVSIINNQVGASTPLSVQVPLTLAQVQSAFSTPVTIIPAQGAGTFIDVIDATINYIYGSAAYTGGGAIQLSYGTGVTTAATGTLAATTLTSIAGNELYKLLGIAVSSTTDANYLNKAINYTNATAVFAGGTGGSAIVNVTYKVIGGLS